MSDETQHRTTLAMSVVQSLSGGMLEPKERECYDAALAVLTGFLRTTKTFTLTEPLAEGGSAEAELATK